MLYVFDSETLSDNDISVSDNVPLETEEETTEEIEETSSDDVEDFEETSSENSECSEETSLVHEETVEELVVNVVDNVTVSGNSISENDITVSGNEIYISDNDTDIVAELQTVNENLTMLNITVLSMSSLLILFFGFTVFKWCEVKIKAFGKGVFGKHE